MAFAFLTTTGSFLHVSAMEGQAHIMDYFSLVR
jgi:hypothetical protein